MRNIPDLMKTASRIFFGTANPPISTDDKTAYDLLDSVLESGINAFDCARSYGKAEQVLGKWIASRKCREKVIILTKCGDVKAGKGYLCEQNMLRLRRAEELAHRYGVSVPEIAMRYVFSNEMNIFAVVSTTSAERLQMNIYAANNPLNAEDVAYLEA